MKKTEKFHAPRGSLVIQGGATGVLLVHSLGGSPLELKFVAQSLSRQGYTVYCPAIPGLTFGTDVSGMSSWRDWYHAVEAAYDELQKHCDHVLIGGASAGAVLALRLAALRGTDAPGIVLFAPTLAVNGWAIPWTFNLFRLISDKWTARLFTFRTRGPHGIKDERVRNIALEHMKGEESGPSDITIRKGGTVYEFLRLVRDVKPLLGRIKTPTLIFHPRQDDQSDIHNTMTLQRKLGGLVEVCVLDDSYHLVTLDKQRGLVADRTVEFAERSVSRVAAGAPAKVSDGKAHQTKPLRGAAE